MAFLLVKVLELGYNRHKKNKASKKAQKEAELYGQQPPYPNAQYPQEPYPMSSYPPGVTPGTDMRYPPQNSTPQSKRAKFAEMLISALRFFQFVFGLTVIGLYGKDVHHDHEDKNEWNSKWVYAVITAFLATCTAIVHMVIPFLMRRTSRGTSSPSNAKLQLPQFVWEFVLCILWLTLFGIFGKLYIGVHADGDSKKQESSLGDASKINRMRHACWIDLINLLMRDGGAATVVDAEKGEEGASF
ncbi:unnamed protein product [Penicillium pancosmium]